MQKGKRLNVDAIINDTLRVSVTVNNRGSPVHGESKAKY